MIKSITVILLSGLVLFSGCSSQKRVVVNQKPLPSWYENPPQNTSRVMYETGEGSTKEDAVNHALNMMLSTLSIAIESKYQSMSIENQGRVENFQKTVSNEIKSDVKKIRISNYEVVKAEDFGFKKYLVLVKSDKKKLFDSLEFELEQQFTVIDRRRETILEKDALKQVAFYKESIESLGNILHVLTVMNVLNSEFEGTRYIDKVETIKRQFSELLSEITFSITSNVHANNLVASIRNGLSDRSYQIEKGAGKKHFNIIVESSIEKAEAYGFTLARSAIVISVKDDRDVIIGSNKLNIIGQSTQGYAVAKENIAIKLNAMIEKEGIEKILGLEI